MWRWWVSVPRRFAMAPTGMRSMVAGDICSRFYDINGIAVETNMNEKTLSIDIARLKQVRYSVGIAIGEEKYTGIIGALRGGYINCLVTNRETAERLLK